MSVTLQTHQPNAIERAREFIPGTDPVVFGFFRPQASPSLDGRHASSLCLWRPIQVARWSSQALSIRDYRPFYGTDPTKSASFLKTAPVKVDGNTRRISSEHVTPRRMLNRIDPREPLGSCSESQGFQTLGQTAYLLARSIPDTTLAEGECRVAVRPI
jgi:hypothetical protein